MIKVNTWFSLLNWLYRLKIGVEPVEPAKNWTTSVPLNRWAMCMDDSFVESFETEDTMDFPESRQIRGEVLPPDRTMQLGMSKLAHWPGPPEYPAQPEYCSAQPSPRPSLG